MDYKRYQTTSQVFGPSEKMNNNKFGGFPARYRNFGNPFSIFDRSATNWFDTNPFSSWSFTHDYSNIADKFTSDEKRKNGIKE